MLKNLYKAIGFNIISIISNVIVFVKMEILKLFLYYLQDNSLKIY